MSSPPNRTWGPFYLVNTSIVTEEGSVKTFFQCVVFLCLVLLALAPAYAQITFTAADVGATMAPGKTISTKIDTVTKTADIGVPGATSWNFTTLKTNFTASVTSVSPNATPFIGFFPGSTNTLQGNSGGYTFYTYLKLGTNLVSEGLGESGPFQVLIRNVPEEILYQFPMTFGTSWTATYADSTTVTLPPPLPPQITVTNHIVINTVDAYGDLTLPGGGVYQALRLRIDNRSGTGTRSVRSISYSILALNGATVSVTALDTLQPNSGLINVSNISWSNPLLSDVGLSSALPAEFALKQNYPNPFNPSTTIEFSLPRSGWVSLTVLNVLGEVVATLADRWMEPGVHSAAWNAAGSSSGVYFYRLQAGDFVQTRKLLLLR
jgi:hypothetical protein